MYYLLTESFKAQETQIVTIILQAVPAQNIYLLGSTLQTRRTESIFMTDAPSCRRAGHYYLLVLLTGMHNLNEIQDKIENRCSRVVPVTAIVMQSERFEEWLISGHEFTRTVVKTAVCLHGEKHVLPVENTASLPIQQREKEYKEGVKKVNEFIAGAELFILRNQNTMAAFMLHQAAEQALNAMLKSKTGLHVVTHNLDKLLRYCCMVCYQLPDVLGDQAAAKEIVGRLQKAYTGARYDNDFRMSRIELDWVLEKINSILQLLS